MAKNFLLLVGIWLVVGCATTAKEELGDREKVSKAVTEAIADETTTQSWPVVEEGLVVFYFEYSGATNVAVAGDFSNWNRIPLQEVKDGVFKAELNIDPGRYQYRFFVNGNWITDPENPQKISDGRGGENSLLEVN